MSTTTAKKPSTRKPAAKPAPKGKAAPKEPTKAPAKAAPKEKPAKPEPKTLIEALTTGQACLMKIRANGTKRSLPFLAVGSEKRKRAEGVVELRSAGATIESLSESMNVSVATVRRFLTNLALAHAVEAGEHDKCWKPGSREVVVHTVTAKQQKA